jgi:hypothetical protein
MTLLAHLFAIAASGLFFENTVQVSVPQVFRRPYSFMFNALNGSGQSFLPNVHGLMEPYYILVSNATAQTPMPPWTDQDWVYLPFNPSATERNSTLSYRAYTPALHGNLTCDVPEYNLTITGNSGGTAPVTLETCVFGTLEVFYTVDNRTVTCVPRFSAYTPNFILAGGSVGKSAVEFVSPMEATNGSTFEDGQFCREQITYGWVRAELTSTNISSIAGFPCLNVMSYNSTVISCRSQIQQGVSDVMVDDNGYVQRRISVTNVTTNVQNLFNTTPSDLLGQINQFAAEKSYSSLNLYWHNDSLPSDFNHYLLSLDMNATEFLDPQLDPPAPQEMIGPIIAQYSRIFAVAIGRNMNLLLEESNSGAQTSGDVLQSQIRVFMSKSLFIIAGIILAMYTIVALILYTRRPWKILVRLPTTLASILAYFAASHAVEDFKSRHSSNECDEDPDPFSGVNKTYGFGTFVGVDEKVHMGIEKHPYLAGLNKTNTALTWRTKASEKGDVDKQWWKRVEFQPSKVKEGGWL